MPFAVQMVWREPRSHLDHWYFCMTNITGFSVQSKHKTEYPNIPSALRPVSHDDSVPVPKPPEEYTLDSEPESEQASTEAGTSTREDQEFSAYSKYHRATFDHSSRVERHYFGTWTSQKLRLSYLDQGFNSANFTL
jgi:hypothetical protein